MAPFVDDPVALKENGVTPNIEEPKKIYKWDICWRSAILLAYLHIGAVYGFWIALCQARFFSIAVAVFMSMGIILGVTCGAHRLWAHRSYKARLPLRIFLCALQTMAMQNHIYEWVRDHRVHHKFTETDADPHNSNRGLFFSHVGWLMLRKHKDVLKKGASVDCRDLLEDPVVVFQRKYYYPLIALGFFAPILFGHYVLNESWQLSWYSMGLFRYCIMLNLTWCVNSVAHLYGTKPYNKHIGPRENMSVASFAMGEGWHNYHHTFPWDYKAAELGNKYNFSAKFINYFASIGWAYDLKTVSHDMIRKRAVRTGDGTWDGLRDIRDFSHFNDSGIDNEHLWGFGDSDASNSSYEYMKITFRENEKIM